MEQRILQVIAGLYKNKFDYAKKGTGAFSMCKIIHLDGKLVGWVYKDILSYEPNEESEIKKEFSKACEILGLKHYDKQRSV